uniref:Uncharacterized protein n=1 Tax=Schistosoma japonicum TaxID=6182 RepID=C1LCK8_SCHJA|nr:hypothetical protein [Schistosoma japonicum]
MIRLSTSVLFIILGIIYSLKANEVTILVLLKSFNYPSKQTADGSWCDDNTEHDYCSPYFVICTTKQYTRRCLSKYTFGGEGPEYENKENITFTEQLGENITNPLQFTMPEWSNDTVIHVAVFNKDLNAPSLLGRSDILIDWIETPGTNESEKWQEVYFTADESEMALDTYVKVFIS